ncbi:MAG: GvpL/GvpF family gas vesicle protein [Thermoleophilaceae bacterium]
MNEALYVYGVLPAAEQRPISATGVEGSRVGTVEHAGIAALTSPVHSSALAAAREVRAHWRVLEEASETATVLPVRFGTLMESEEAVRESLLEPNAERLAGLLQEVAGCVQLSVKGEYDEERLLRDVVRRSPAVAQLRERLRTLPGAAGYYDRIRLGELVAGEVARQRDEDTRLVLERLEPLAAAAAQEQPTQQNAAFNLAFLVNRDRQSAFTQGVSKLGEELAERIEMRYVGPLPPYSFAEADLGTATWD